MFCASAAPAQSPAPRPSPLIPLTNAHAHNDYQHKRPLFDALDRGFCSVEADIWLTNGQLLVAHDFWRVKPERTLQALYLDPLRDRIKKNGGHVYPEGPEIVLLVEIKNDWKTTYPVLRKTLQDYADQLTSYRSGKKQTGAITVIITGHRSKEMLKDELVRIAALDGDLADLDSGAPAELVPWISANWSQNFKWRGVGPFPDSEKEKLRSIVTKAHQQGRRVRWWGAPDQINFWREMRADGVDLINTDDLEGVRMFLTTAEHG
ncbi:MAG: hypothetical protein C5B50_00230 [Verrucomicrobia bacterium]|nr:MAG: hypothetical protein C5B50_00230 [Verrucomicrobiota bacterium]